MAVKFSTQHEVVYYECDFNGRMTFPAMIAAAIKTSEDQSEALNRGADFVNKLGLTWILTNYQLQITRMPRVGEKLTISTMAMEYNKYFCYRHFWIADAQGNQLVLIESVFALMNIENRKMASVPEAVIAPYESEKVTRIRRYPKIEKVVEGQSQFYQVRVYDIDSNHHVNNAVYFNWLLDVLGMDFLTSHEPVSALIRYDKEIEYGVQVESRYDQVPVTNENGEALITTRHEIRVGAAVCCEANITWRKK